MMTIRTLMITLCVLSVGTIAWAQDITFGGVPLRDCPPMSEQMKNMTPQEKANMTRDPSTFTEEELKVMHQEALDKAPTPERHAKNPPCKLHEQDKQSIQGLGPPASSIPEDVKQQQKATPQ